MRSPSALLIALLGAVLAAGCHDVKIESRFGPGDIGIYDDLYARRVTERHKIGFMFTHSYDEQRYRLDFGDLLVANRSYSGTVRSVWSLGKRFSAGLSEYAGTTTFSNYRFREQFGPTVEYDFFPYDDSAGRLVTATEVPDAIIQRL